MLPPSAAARLAAAVGRPHARNELRWLRDAARDAAHLDAMLARRLRGEPLQYIIGNQPFGPLNLLVRPPVLIPRPETEHWTLRLAQHVAPNPARPVALLDLGTGSGCIPLLLCHLWPPGSVHADAVDVSPDAIQLATENAAHSDVLRQPARISAKNTFNPILASYLSPTFTALVNPPYDILVSNPPYIAHRDYRQLSPSVKNYEDPQALVGGTDGLDFYRAIAQLVARDGFLAKNGMVALEVGVGQAERVREIITTTGKMRETEVWLDPWGKERTVIARM